MSVHASHPEGAVGHIDVSPGDDDGVFNRFDGTVCTHKCAISFVSDLDVDGATFSILSEYKLLSVLICAPSSNMNDAFVWINNDESTKLYSPYLCVDLEVTLSSLAGIDGEFSWLVHSDTSRLQAWPVGFYL